MQSPLLNTFVEGLASREVSSSAGKVSANMHRIGLRFEHESRQGRCLAPTKVCHHTRPNLLDLTFIALFLSL